MQSFRFVVFTDTHINASETETASPWPVNRLANARARAAVAAINALAPDFAIHLGDVIQPLPGHAGFEAASERADRILGGIACPLRVLPGNHDVGDKPLQWSPADLVTEPSVDAFRCTHGDDRIAFEHQGCAFVGINAQLINSGFRREEEQWNWLDAKLSDAGDRRVFVFLHYPPFLCHDSEHEHYDNLGEPGRARFLDLLRQHRAEACFSGHVHNFFYNRIGATRLYTLPAVSFVRHDYSELFQVPPEDSSFGRDDGGKLGLMVVDVDAAGHSVRLVRSQGAADAQADAAPEPAAPFALPPLGSRVAPGRFGVTLRHDWARVRDIPPSGAVDEFRRKPARDDYFVAALWDCGLSQLRVPVDDILDPACRTRLALLAEDGFTITVFCYGLPDEATGEALGAVPGAALEIVAPLPDLERAMPALGRLAGTLNGALLASPLRPRHDETGGKAFIHRIRHGFSPDEPPPGFLAQGAVTGLCFSIGQQDDPGIGIAQCVARAADLGKTAHVHVATGLPNPAEADRDLVRAKARTQAACIAAHRAPPGSSVWLDAAVDVDRGYFPRLSLIDRRSNPTALGLALGELQASLLRQQRPTVS